MVRLALVLVALAPAIAHAEYKIPPLPGVANSGPAKSIFRDIQSLAGELQF